MIKGTVDITIIDSLFPKVIQMSNPIIIVDAKIFRSNSFAESLALSPSSFTI